MSPRPLVTVVLLAILFLAPSAAAQTPDVPRVAWQPVDSLQARLPASVRVFEGHDPEWPLRAWYVVIDEQDPTVETRVAVADDPSGHETVASFARDARACVAVNGGYFAMGERPARHVGLLQRGDSLWAPSTRSVRRGARRYETARAALGLTRDERVELTWATTRGGTLFRWPAPPGHGPRRVAPPLRHEGARPWRVRDAVGAGPMLLRDGRLRVTADEEVFFGTSIPATHPRTAAGRTADGDLVVMVVDGRQPASRGVDLAALAHLMRSAGAVDALNLDGGGSSTLVVAGVLLNRPAGDTLQRPVMSALVTTCGRAPQRAPHSPR